MTERRSATSPDPILTASIYAAGQLDEVLTHAIVPFWHEAHTSTGCGPEMWVVRYRRRGEHLKVRIHGAPEYRETLQRLLAGQVDRFFSRSRQSTATATGAHSQQPPIDVDDESTDVARDQSLVWTTYRRSPVSLASSWLADDGYVAHSCACMARGCDLLLHALPAAPIAGFRERLLLQAMLAAFAPLGFENRERSGLYLRYHRDWLLRFFLRDPEAETRALVVFDAQVHARKAAVDRMRNLALADRQTSSDPLFAWAEALGDFAAYIDSFRGCREYEVDPYASDLSFLPMFKVLHGFANQLGLSPLQEAYVYHLLLAVAVPDLGTANRALTARAGGL
jgi:hypothetical protein